MTNPTRPKAPVAGGFILAISTIAGALIGASDGQPTIGFLIGFGAGAAIAVAIWLVGRNR